MRYNHRGLKTEPNLQRRAASNYVASYVELCLKNIPVGSR